MALIPIQLLATSIRRFSISRAHTNTRRFGILDTFVILREACMIKYP